MKSLYIIIALTIATTMSGQFNSKVGYSGAYVGFDQLNSLFDSYDEQNKAWLENNLSGIHTIHGLEIGGRYRVSGLGFEIGLVSGSGKASAIGVSPDTGTKKEIEWKASLFDIHFNITQYFGNIGLGLGVVRQKLKLRELNSITDDFVDVTDQKNWNGKVFLQMEVPSKNVSFVLRPYYQFSLDPYDIQDVATALEVSATDGTSQDVQMIGLSILFFNGPQR